MSEYIIVEELLTFFKSISSDGANARSSARGFSEFQIQIGKISATSMNKFNFVSALYNRSAFQTPPNNRTKFNDEMETKLYRFDSP